MVLLVRMSHLLIYLFYKLWAFGRSGCIMVV